MSPHIKMIKANIVIIHTRIHTQTRRTIRTHMVMPALFVWGKNDFKYFIVVSTWLHVYGKHNIRFNYSHIKNMVR